MPSMKEGFGYLFGDIGRLMRRRFDEMSRDLGVTSAQWRVLLTVGRNPGVNQGALAEHLEVEPITTCRMVDRLEQAGLVERRSDPKDRRAWQLFLTENAIPLVDRLKERGNQLEARALEGLDQKSIDALNAHLQIIRSNLSSTTDRREANHG
ncbi:MarR family winged helix-turn-helix transcriptional regulator [Rhizorhapis suberifaciens]|uniref:DNA-binding MarR family transcriptional regulator n=1 Tax=Rhizorhapis suberifaciens TaxID=13656 RepID=A0A840HUJ9_9SPHN|nr:MarR family transcriptional regulator [Rhizorhapis suberifaciens]MBB4641695.1 DNA-binding MarR family transcriptional regulator [Rhizorhapis suberifaciens]